MGYLGHINNLYREPEFLTGPDTEVIVLEKIHGTSAHVGYRLETYRNQDRDSILEPEQLFFFSGGEKRDNFLQLFDHDALRGKLRHECQARGADSITVYGEAYGGKQQGMKATYGDSLRFVAFDVKVGGAWLSVADAWGLCWFLGLDFVWWAKVPNKLEALDAARDQDSQQAIKNGMGPGKLAEGVVIRPLVERCDHRGNRVILKHKRKEFRETTKPREVSLERVQVLQDAQAIADEWVTEERLSHVLDKLAAGRIAASIDAGTTATYEHSGFQPKDTPEVIRAMFEDVRREGDGEIEWSKEAERCVGQRTAKLFKARVTQVRDVAVEPAPG